MIHQITKDKNGFIWIATNDGLVRFDGVNQRVYKNNPQQKNTTELVVLNLTIPPRMVP